MKTENSAPEGAGMTGDSFMYEVRHRASLLSSGLHPGSVLMWSGKGDNRSWLYRLHAISGAFMTACFTTEKVKGFWQIFTEQPTLRQLLRCMNSEMTTLYRRGLKGDRYSVPVFHLVIHGFMTGYSGGICHTASCRELISTVYHEEAPAPPPPAQGYQE
ncbi:hypothetical protein Q6Z19_002644 [Salmonella enterica]|nr:hypothetical protein [Salmonella enterica subsp. enterica serovar Carrau]EEJ7417032.1 hypothetical protein [Salmonella enterica subsp. enterica serovar Sandiego]EIG1272154.1 hypothetical protein [Salmonella enterica]HCM4641999.1 hypothetical protein [Salmonella enterica subsp. enterica serovar Panama]EJJ0394082.1 hypothetical protein [Salmonella enterica]